jgi:hypothetical protein
VAYLPRLVSVGLVCVSITKKTKSKFNNGIIISNIIRKVLNGQSLLLAVENAM